MQLFNSIFVFSLIVSVFALNSFTAPSGSETLTTGETYIIRWNDTDGGANVDLLLKKGDSNNLQTALTIATDLRNAGAVRWAIPDNIESGNDYALEIINKENINDVNYSPRFSIVSGNGFSSITGANSTTALITPTEVTTSAVITKNNTTVISPTTGVVNTTTTTTTGALNTTTTTTTGALNTTTTSVRSVFNSTTSFIETSTTTGNFSVSRTSSSSSTTFGNTTSGTSTSRSRSSVNTFTTSIAGGGVATTAGPNGANIASYNSLLLANAIAGIGLMVM